MPTFRPDLKGIDVYRPGAHIEDIARRYGLAEVTKLASNECPYPPFPEVQQAIAAETAGLNRYPDNSRRRLRRELARFLDVTPGHLWVGGGSNELMLMTALAVGGPGTSAVYAHPSFGLYRIATKVAGSQGVEVPLDDEHRHDLDAMAAALRPDTTAVYVCNPNNPTGTHVAADKLFEFAEAIPERILVVIDEAYVEFPSAADYDTALPLAAGRANVVVARTFSKAHGLAGLRCGYLVGHPDVLGMLKRIQLPFTVSSLAQAAAAESLQHPDRLRERAEENAAELKLFRDELSARGIEHADSQTNFVYMRAPAPALSDELLAHGIIVRDYGGGWIRVTIGTADENRRFFDALDRTGT